MPYTQIQLRLIGKKIPELRYKPEPTLNNAIVEFLKKYEVYVTPPNKKKFNKRWSYRWCYRWISWS